MQRAAVVAQGHQPLRVVAVDEGHRGDGAGLDHGTAGPGEHQAETATPGQPQVVVLAALVGEARAQLRVAQRADQHQRASAQPEGDIQRPAVGMLGDQGREAEDADAHHHADQHGLSLIHI